MTFANMSNLLRDLHSSPALSLTLAGIFRDGVEEEAVEVSSENSGAGNNNIKSGDIEYFVEQISVDDEDEENNNGSKKKKRKTYHRHSPEQIREMEALFKESPHPDEKQRLRLSKELGLHPRQVKFWFQNRRTQIKAIQERHENSILKAEIDKLRQEIKSLRETINDPSCPNCGFCTSNKDNESITCTNNKEQKLRIENAKLKSEVEKLRSIITGKSPSGASPNSSSYNSGNDQENRQQSCADYYSISSGLEKSCIMNNVSRAMDELVKMATCVEPLWMRSYETGREILNYDEYVKEFCDISMQTKKAIEASRESAIVFADLPWLIRTFMDANQWKELFPTLVSKATTLDVVSDGEGISRDGAIHLMFEEIQMLTPMVPTREIYFFRYCKQLSSNKWAIVDVSIDKIEDKIDESMLKCRKRPSGCIIEDVSNGHCKVTWVEHIEGHKSAVHSLYRSIVNNGIAFGAKHWISSLQRQCERLVFVMATNVPTRDSSGVSTIAGRKNTLKLAQRMTSSFCKALGYSSFNSWSKITCKSGEDVRVSCRKNLNDPSEPIGMIMCAVSSVWLPISHNVLFNYLRDESRRHEWDITCNGNTIQLVTNLAKGQDRGNSVTSLAMEADERKLWILQDSTTTSCESLVVYAHVDTNSMQDVMAGCDSRNVTVLPSGFSIIPDGIEYRPLVITSKTEEKNAEGASLLTVAFQILTSDVRTAKLSEESADSAKTLISTTLQNIKRSLQCEDS